MVKAAQIFLIYYIISSVCALADCQSFALCFDEDECVYAEFKRGKESALNGDVRRATAFFERAIYESAKRHKDANINSAKKTSETSEKADLAKILECESSGGVMTCEEFALCYNIAMANLSEGDESCARKCFESLACSALKPDFYEKIKEGRCKNAEEIAAFATFIFAYLGDRKNAEDFADITLKLKPVVEISHYRDKDALFEFLEAKKIYDKDKSNLIACLRLLEFKRLPKSYRI